MKKNLTTPARARALGYFILIMWLCAPLIEAIYYNIELNRGRYSPEADAILIPIMQFTIGWLVFSPLVAIISNYILKKYPGEVSLFAWNKKNQARSIIISMIFAAFIIGEIVFVIKSINSHHSIDVIYSLFLVYLALMVRASIIMGEKKSENKGTVSL